MKKRRSALAISINLLWWLMATACQSWAFTPRPVVGQMPAELRVMKDNGEQFTLKNARMVGDSIRGFIDGNPPEIGVSASHVIGVQRKQVSAGRTTALVLGAVGGVILLVSVAAILTLGEAFCGATQGSSCE